MELLQVRDVSREFFLPRRTIFGRRQRVRAVDGISLSLKVGETLAIVGESGSGKSTLGRCIARLDVPTSGDIFFDGMDTRRLSAADARRFRRDVQVIFQDPYGSLNPRRRVGLSIVDGLAIHKLVKRDERRHRAEVLLERVGLRAEHADRYPHQFSGGQRQRIAIARALALSPRLLIADEAVSALDVSVRAEILNLLQSIQQDDNVACLFISHDLGVVRHVADRIAVMKLGRLVETGLSEAIFEAPTSAYTQALLKAVPRIDLSRRRRARK